MSAILEQIRMWVEQIISSIGYVGIALLMLIENLFPPIPSEVVMPFAGSLAARGEMNPVGVFVAGTIGALAGAVAIYYIGMWFNKDRTRQWFEKHGHWLLMSEGDFDQAMDTFDRHGKKMIFFGRLMPAIRSLISLPAGIERMNLGTFLLYTALGTSIWNIILLGAGMLLGRNWQQVLNFVNTYEMIIWAILGLLIAYYVFKRLRGGQEEEQQAST